MDRDTRLIDVTWGDVEKAIREMVAGSAPVPQKGPEKWLVYGINGLAELLGCSIPQAQRIKSTGVLDAAIIQYGKIIITDADKALGILKKQR